MTKEELIRRLRQCESADTESGHIEADKLLIEYINDPDVKAAYDDIDKWYA